MLGELIVYGGKQRSNEIEGSHEIAPILCNFKCKNRLLFFMITSND